MPEYLLRLMKYKVEMWHNASISFFTITKTKNMLKYEKKEH